VTGYVELRCRSAFSFLDGACAPEPLVARAAEMGYGALGLCDTADLGGIVRFAQEAREHGVRPVIGSELRVGGHPLGLLVRDEAGYRNLSALVTRARLNARRGVPEVTWSAVAERSAGLHLLTGPPTGELGSLIRTGRPDEAERALGRYREAFGDRLAVEVQLHQVSGSERALAGGLVELAGRGGVPWVATNEPRYLDDDGRLVHDLFTTLRGRVDVDTAARRGLLLPNGEWRLKSPREMRRVWGDRPEGLEESVKIAGACRFDTRWLAPPVACPPRLSGTDLNAFLREQVYAGAVERWGRIGERERAQIDHELGVIRRLDFAGFFLVMWDAVRFARRQGILCQGRGSAANSVVAFCLGVTAVDPVRNNLLFERFLSEGRMDGRAEAPDIDVDFEMHRREEVLTYIYDQYDRDHSAITAVTQVYHAPSALQDAMRALGYPAEQAFAISKRLRRDDPAAGAEALEGELAERFGLDVAAPRGRTLLTAMRALSGVPRMRSTHPGGFVLSSAPLGAYMPIERTTMGRTILQFDKDDLDLVGVPKFDFLGLGGLTATRIAFDSIEKRTGRRHDLYDLPQDDPETFAMISRGETLGTFQIESRAQIQSILQTRPERLYDLVVQVALIRPGPIQGDFVAPYTRRRRGLEEWTHIHPALAPILERTYGIPIFQEQAMAISIALGGYTPAEADELRRTMGHRRKMPRLEAALKRLRDRFIAQGLSEELSDYLISQMKGFGNYGFPESHAWSFALIAYATAYLKCHYPADFLAGLLNAWPMGFYAPATLVHEARRAGVEVRPPCLKVGEWDCTIEDASRRPSCHPEEPRRPSRHPEEPQTTKDLQLDDAAPELQILRCAQDDSGTAAHHDSGTAAHDDSETAARDDDPGPTTDDRRPTTPFPAVRIGWRHIRGIGKRAGEALQRARAGGPFVSVEDVIRRAGLSRAEALHLARAGAFEAFEPGRRKAAWEALRAAGDLLPLAPSRHLPFDPAEMAGQELIFLDYLATGICTHGHPMEHLRERLAGCGIASSRDLLEMADGDRIVVAGLVIARQHPETAMGTVFVLLEDEFGYINVIVPARLYEKNRETVKFSRFLVVEGRFEREGEVLNVVGFRFRELEAQPLAFRSHDFQ
jgi:error-prone DNA polymerase